MIHTVIFSKDRACQCDLCLRSLFHNDTINVFDKISVIYAASKPYFVQGYELLQRRWNKMVDFVWQDEYDSFKDATVATVDDCHTYMMFMVDDNIMYREFPSYPEEYLLEKNIKTLLNNLFTKCGYMNLGCFSLRLGRNTIIQDPYLKTQTEFPKEYSYDDVFMFWNWTQVNPWHNFGYPLSLDATIFQVNTILPILRDIDYNNPNSLEGALQSQRDKLPRYMGCFQQSLVVNTPLNRVQDTCKNREGEYFPADAKYLNEQFLQGKRILLGDIDFSNIVGCHQELQVQLCNTTF